MQWRKNVANYLQRRVLSEGYLVAKMVRTGKKQLIALPPAVDENATNIDNQRIIRAEEVEMVAKRLLKLEDALKKGYATVYDQCSQEVKDKLEATNNWECIQQDQSLNKLIQKVEWICIGFNDHKQEVFNLVQAFKTLFLYTQGEKDGVNQYGRNFRSLWGMVKAFRGLPGVHKRLVEELVKNPSQVNNVNNVTPKECREADETACKVVKAALLISGADKRQYSKLKDKLANNYLLGTDQYPDTLKQGETKDQQEEGHQLLNVMLAQGENLPENRAYLDGCSTVMAFKTDKYLKGIKTLPSEIKINCNAGAVLTNRIYTYGKLKVWYLPGGIANIFLMHKLEKLYQITYDSWEGHYIIHTPQGAVKFYKDEQGLPYIKLEASTKAAVMLLQSAQPEEMTRIETATTLVQTV